MTQNSTRPSVLSIYHPTLAVHDLDRARRWFHAVFGRKPLRWEETLDLSLLNPEYPVNYSFFAFVCDIHWVYLCPELHARGSLSRQTRYRNVPEGMIGMGWYTADAVEIFNTLAEHGIRSHDQQGLLITPEKPPTSSFATDVLTGFTEPADTGIRWEFQETGKRHWEYYSREADLRLRPDWTGPSLEPNDPLGLKLTSHHTIVTREVRRSLELFLDILGAVQIGGSRNEELGCDSTYVQLADTVLEFALPDAGTPLHERVADGADLYYGVSYLVDDEERVAAHLSAVEVSCRRSPDGAVVIDPVDGFGVEWRFATSRPYDDSVPRPGSLHWL